MDKCNIEFPRFPMLKTVEQMSRISGIGENTLRTLMSRREIEYVRIGNKRLLVDQAIFAWYDSKKIPARKRKLIKLKRSATSDGYSNAGSKEQA